ncbi:hypothetical protein BDN72DRAFT_884581 [Pluteus cervinus]|uniref:Uncharacterized protein n=1 Tax=Pluteus cervinus TaxID=181527 RepID=A0ACD3BH31_9AGAR|nr:hypothetical protein BDN72DRAFT_884581 [Pluteus cervinus]
MPIFQDGTGLAVKFFIQKDLPQEVQAELCETITSLGGRVESKVPRQGYILVQPGTSEAERLRLCWTAPDRPDRHFVPYTYVEACKIAGMLLKQIFVENGGAIGMHIHPSIANVNARSALSQRIMHSGGDPTASAQAAHVILADPNTEVFHHLVKVYQGVPDKYIESYLWVKKCIEKGQLVYTPLVYKNPGGRRPGEERTQFSTEDEEHLCRWIAAKIPYKETGGRTGNRLYQQLCDLSNDPEYAWVRRHTWQSWRERYKKNSARLDSLIATIVEQKKPIPGEKGQYGYVRQAEERPKRPRKRRSKPDQKNEAEDLTDASKYGLEMAELSNMSLSTSIPAPAAMPVGSQEHLHDTSFQPLMSTAVSALYAAGPSTRPGAAEEEMEEADEWAVKIGDAPPPMWAKRKAGDDQLEGPSEKRMRASDGTLSTQESLQLPPNHPLSPEALVHIASLHVIDQSIREIAKEYRFTVEEVQEYYDKCGEMTRTQTRFQSMRQMLELKFPVDE